MLLLTIFAASLLTSSANAKGPAGTVLYFQQGEQVFLLLADHSSNSRGWGSFGGGENKGETSIETAARETEEETRGYFPRELIEQKIAGQKPVVSKGFSLYFVEIPFVPAQRIRNNPSDKSDKSTFERDHYAWIPFSEVKKAINKRNPSIHDLKINSLYLSRGTKTNFFWDVWIQNMRHAAEQGVVPWEVQ